MIDRTPLVRPAQYTAEYLPASDSGALALAGTRRSGKVMSWLIVALVLIGAGSLAAWPFLPGGSPERDQNGPLTTPVRLGPFVCEVIERGEVESSSNVEIRCEVQSRNSSGTTILEIVPEGTYVEKGDFLVKLDDSALKAELLQQDIVCNNSLSQVIEAQADVEAARLTLEEYESGTFKQELEQLESSEFVAKENLRRSQEYLRHSELLAVRGYISAVQLEADRFAVEKANKELAVAQTKLEVLRNFTKSKMLNQLEANLKTANARLRSLENSNTLDNARLEQIKDQIAKCVIQAPSSGQVVYANDPNVRTLTGDVLIAEGRQVRERQIIVRLPDPKRMQVVAKINESRIDRVHQGMEARVFVDAFPAVELRGVVRQVSEYPLPQTNRFLEHIKEYATDVEIFDPPEGLRSGMTAEVAILVERLDQAVQVPPQAILERDGRFFCLQHDRQLAMVAREVEIGSANEEFVVITRGLQPGEQVVLNPQKYEQQVVISQPESLATHGRPTGSNKASFPGSKADLANRAVESSARAP